MDEGAQRLSLGPHRVGKDLGDEDEHHRALRDGEGGDKADQRGQQQPAMLPRRLAPPKSATAASEETDDHAHRADHQQEPPPQAIDDKHRGDR